MAKAPPARDGFADALANAFGPRSPREHFEALVAAIDLSLAIVPPERLQAVLDWKDPLPPESITNLERLRRAYKERL